MDRSQFGLLFGRQKIYPFFGAGRARILEIGCGTGDLLARLKPSYGVGIDCSEKMIDVAKRNHPDLHFITGDIEDPAALDDLKADFDYIVLSDTIGYFDDIQSVFNQLRAYCTPKHALSSRITRTSGSRSCGWRSCCTRRCRNRM